MLFLLSLILAALTMGILATWQSNSPVWYGAKIAYWKELLDVTYDPPILLVVIVYMAMLSPWIVWLVWNLTPVIWQRVKDLRNLSYEQRNNLVIRACIGVALALFVTACFL